MGLDSWCKQICHLGCEVCNNGALLPRWQSGTAEEASRVVWTGGWVVAVQRKRETRRTRRQRRGSARVCLSVCAHERDEVGLSSSSSPPRYSCGAPFLQSLSSMKISVKTLKGNHFDLNVSPSDTVCRSFFLTLFF